MDPQDRVLDHALRWDAARRRGCAAARDARAIVCEREQACSAPFVGSHKIAPVDRARRWQELERREADMCEACQQRVAHMRARHAHRAEARRQLARLARAVALVRAQGGYVKVLPMMAGPK